MRRRGSERLTTGHPREGGVRGNRWSLAALDSRFRGNDSSLSHYLTVIK
jgi:hypothetical protein